jgi:hypothetical protein
MESLKHRDLIDARKWKRATLTTYAFGASYAEAVIIDALIRAGVNDIVLLTDDKGMQMALNEHGAVRIGREYQIHPVVVSNGCFHPKIFVLESDDEIHALVGSGNLTCGGWSANLECVDHIDTVRHPNAILGLADFFEDFATSPRALHGAQEVCSSLARRMQAKVANSNVPNAGIDVIHSLRGTIAAQIVDAATALGGALKLTCVSPYWQATALDRLADDLGLPICYAHVPKPALIAPTSMDWPRDSDKVKPVTVKAVAQIGIKTPRALHAKLIEIICKHGRLLLCGSANTTLAALYSTGTHGNIECCTLRRERNTSSAWETKPAKIPSLPDITSNDLEKDDEVGILTASYQTDTIEGQILTGWRSTSAIATLEWSHSDRKLGSINVDPDRRFSLPIDDPEGELTLAGRLLLTLQSGDGLARGFVLLPDFKFIKGQTGKALDAILNTIRNIHTPADILAVLNFYARNPQILASSYRGSGKKGTASEAQRKDPVVIARLVGNSAPNRERENSKNSEQPTNAERAMAQLIARLFKSMAQAIPISSDRETDSDDGGTRKHRSTPIDRWGNIMDKIAGGFTRIFEVQLEKVCDDGSFFALFYMTQFVCVSTEHAATHSYLSQLINIVEREQLGHDARMAAAWCAIFLENGNERGPSLSRSRLLNLGVDPDQPLDGNQRPTGFETLMAPNANFEAIFADISQSRTVFEEIAELELQFRSGAPAQNFKALPKIGCWLQIENEFRRGPEKGRLTFYEELPKACRHCNITLSQEDRNILKRDGAIWRNCHGVLLTKKS